MSFPDVEKAISSLIEDIAPAYRATDEDLSEKAPLFLVERTGTGASTAWQDQALVEVSAFANTRPESVELTRALVDRLSGLRGVQTEFGFLDAIDRMTAPAQVPYPDADVRLLPSTWIVTSRSQSL